MSLAVWYGIWVLAALLLFAEVAIRLIELKYSSKEIKNVHTRINTWCYIIGVFISIFFFPSYVVIAIFLIIGGLALLEVLKPLFQSQNRHLQVFILAMGLSALIIFSVYGGYFLYCYNKSIFFFFIVLVQLNDIFQYLWGKGLGKRAILPKISPSKTWEGFLGGVFSCAVLSLLIASYFIGTDFFQSLLVGIFIAMGGFMADATVSAFKRSLSVKDLGTILPGHGGLLDRLDSLLYVLSIVTIYIKLRI